ncbi:insulinase family protein [Agarilytica rhodophyticola]|uniref:insulinase family protein n=1 Tax=Agarilytica rhodophyticola TaxID=1737490 RepID=UPI000B340F46|nr:insulinase family protein [Agarilytica rhodophyticola]
MRFFYFLACLIVFVCPLLSAKTPIIVNDSDHRKFEYFSLDNTLQVLLISDVKAEKAAAALDVAVGSGDDPKDRYGLAHFLEHMLFLGTEKYPVVGEFQDFIAGHGGRHNAYTSLMHTNYFFDIDAKSFEQGLDRFAQFFISPLIMEDYVARERNAVHSEYASKLKSEARRERDVFRELVLPGHPLSKFSTGNHSTLSGVPVSRLQKELFDFYNTQYSANKMVLVLSGPFELVQLKTWAVNKFSAIKNKNVAQPQSHNTLFADGFLPAEVHIKPQKELRKVTFSFPIPSTLPHTDKKPTQYIGNFIGHEGEGSLLSLLKKERWASSLSAGSGVRWHGGETFNVTIRLTKEGLNNLSHIRDLMFDYIALIKRNGISQWRYRELAKLSKMSFDFGERGNPIREVSRLARDLHETTANKIFWYNYNWDKFDEVLIRRYLGELNVNNMLTVIVAPETIADKESEFYQAPYRVITNNTSQHLENHSTVKKAEFRSHKLTLEGPSVATYKKLKKQMDLPKANPFVPSNFTIYEESFAQAKENIPQLIYQRDGVQGWFLNDNIYSIPKGFVSSRFLLPTATHSPELSVTLDIFAKIIKDALNKLSYNASLAGLSYSLNATAKGIDLDFYGYNASLPELSSRVLKVIRNFNRSKKYRLKMIDAYFDDVREELLRIQRNRRYDKVYAQVFRDVPSVLYSPYWSSQDLEVALDKLTKKRFIELSENLFDDAQLEALVYGNFREKDAKKYFSGLRKILKKKDQHVLEKSKVVNLSQAPLFVKSLVVDSQESVAAIYLQGRDDSIEEQAKVLILQQMMSSPFYQTLRTQQQLGYIVQSANYTLRDVPGIAAVVQSPQYSPYQIYQRMLDFFKNSKNEIFKNFARDKNALVIELKEQAKNQGEWANHYWASILDKDFSFDERKRLIAVIENITRGEIDQLYDDMLIKNGADMIFVASNKEIPAATFDPSAKGIKDYKKFKDHMLSYTYD